MCFSITSHDIEFDGLKSAVQAVMGRDLKKTKTISEDAAIFSERCHPNALGHNFMFSELDRSDGSIQFCDEREPRGNAQTVLAALALLPLTESIMTRLNDSILKVSNLHHRISPVGSASTD